MFFSEELFRQVLITPARRNCQYPASYNQLPIAYSKLTSVAKALYWRDKEFIKEDINGANRVQLPLKT